MRCLAIVGVLALAACGRQHSPQDQAVRDARDVAAVEEVNRNAIKPLEPQPILYPDIEKSQLHGTGCAFAAGDGLGSAVSPTGTPARRRSASARRIGSFRMRKASFTSIARNSDKRRSAAGAPA